MPPIRFNPRQTSAFSTDPSYATQAAQESFEQAEEENQKALKAQKINSLMQNPILQYETGKAIVDSVAPSAAATMPSSALGSAYSNSGVSILDSIPEFGVQGQELSLFPAEAGADVGATGGAWSGASTGEASGFLPYAGAAAGLYGLYDLSKGWGSGDRTAKGLGMGAAQGAASGAAIGSVIPGVGTGIGAGVGAIYGLASKYIKTGKHKDQLNRDATRQALKGSLIDDNYNVKLADGTAYNIGVDGGARPEYGQYKGQNMRPYELNLDDPTVQNTIPLINPLVSVITGGDPKQTSDFTGYLVRAAMSNANGDMNKIMQNIQSFYAQLSASPTAMKASLDKLKSEGKLTDEQYNVYVNSVNRATAGMKFGDEAPSMNMPTISFGGYRPPAQKIMPPPPPGVADVTSGLGPAMQTYQNTYGQSGGLQQAFNNLSGNFRR